MGDWHEYNGLKYSNTNIIPSQVQYYYDDEFNQDYSHVYTNRNKYPRITVQKTKPVYSNEFWSNKNVSDLVTAKDLNDLNEFLKTSNSNSEIKNLFVKKIFY